MPQTDPDIDGPDTQQAHHTTAVVSVHELFTSLEPESTNASNTQEESTDIPIQRIPIGLTISPSKFQTIHLKIILQDDNRVSQQNTAFLMKSHN